MRLRSLLFVPADSERKFAKASGIGADALILDLEDAVAPPRKALAREMVKNLLGGPPRDWAFLVRINPLGSGLTLGDIAAIVRENDVGEIVVGLPLGLSGTRGEAADHAEKFAEALRGFLGIPVSLQDERLTTVQAERQLKEAGVRGRDRRAVVDQSAAVIILQAYLDRAQPA